MKYIDADKLIAEIERWRDKEKEKYNESTYSMGRCDALAEFRNHIVSLQQEEEVVEVDLEKEFAHEYAIYHLPTFIIASLVDGTELIDFIYKTARHFYNLARQKYEK